MLRVHGPLLAFILFQSTFFWAGCSTTVRQASMDWDNGYWTASDGHTLPFQVWEPRDGPVVGEVMAVHGLGGRDTDFIPLVETLNGQGLRLVAVNMRGSGLEPEESARGDVPSWRLWVRDLNEFAILLSDRDPDLPRFLAGESLGSILAIHLAAHNPSPVRWKGLILFSPVIAIQGEDTITFWQRQLFRLLRTFAGWYRIDPEDFIEPGVPPPQVTRDRAHRAYLAEAPHMLRSFTIRYLAQIQQAIENARHAWERQPLPALVFFAGRDIFISADRVEAFFGAERTPGGMPLETRYFEEAFHLLLYDPVTPEVLGTLKDWLERTGAAGFQGS